MTRAISPRAGFAPHGAVGGWVLLAACWGTAGVFGMIWVAARIAAWATGGQVAPFGFDFAADVARGHTAAAVAATAWAILRRLPDPVDPIAALADNPGIAQLKPDAAARRARQLRRSLATVEKVEPRDIGLALGDLMHDGPTL